MRLSGDEFSNRMWSYAAETVDLIYDVDSLSDEMSELVGEIITDSELDEAEVVRRLEELYRKYRENGCEAQSAE